jgi:hypothetical protein
LGVGVGEIEAVVIDDLCLLLQPTTPARLTDFCGDALAELVGEWGECEPRMLLATMSALDCFRHD